MASFQGCHFKKKKYATTRHALYVQCDDWDKYYKYVGESLEIIGEWSKNTI
jgi:hypothetical protein